MSEAPFLPLTGGTTTLVPSSNTATTNRHFSRRPMSTGGSPTFRRDLDDLLSNLTPSAAVEAFRNPSGPLKECLDSATVSERSFAAAAAVASKEIHNWLGELSEWPWPRGPASAGFLSNQAMTKRRKISGDWNDGSGSAAGEPDLLSEVDNPWLGCLRASDVACYEKRIEEIQLGLDRLDIEGIKRHVLHNHIMPLSRPGTPISDSNRSARFFNKMDDLTALITATVVQALPNLSKLVQIVDIWTVRLLVLRRIPLMLDSLDDAEFALQSGWKAIDPDRLTNKSGSPSSSTSPAPLLRRDFEVMQAIIQQKVARSAQHIDFLLDTLDGREETVPDEWIDRMDSVERGYGEWVAVCEKRLREAEWASFVVKALHEGQPASATKAEQPTTEPNQEERQQQPPPTQSLLNEPQERPSSSASDSTTLIHAGPPDEPVPTSELPPMRNVEPQLSSNREMSPPSSPPSVSVLKKLRPRSVSFSDRPTVFEAPKTPEDDTTPKTPLELSFLEEDDADGEEADEPNTPRGFSGSPSRMSVSSEDDQLQQQISEILESIPAKIHLSSQPTPAANHLNPPDLQLPHLKPPRPPPSGRSSSGASYPNLPPRSHSSMSASSRAGTPSFLLSPAYARSTRPRAAHRSSNNQKDIKLYHLSRSTGEAPIKLFIRLVGENGERVMVRVGGGWADLGEYLKEYAIHHGRRSKAGGESKIEVKDLPIAPVSQQQSSASKLNSSPASNVGRPASALEYSPSPITPLNVRKTRRSVGEDYKRQQNQQQPQQQPKTPFSVSSAAVDAATAANGDTSTPSSEASNQSRSSSRLSWTEEDSSLGMSGPRTKNVEMSDESRAWVQSVKEKVRIASGERRTPSGDPQLFGEMGKVGATKRLFRKG